MCYSNGLAVPYSRGNITYSALAASPQPRPGYEIFFNTPLFEFVKATAIRVKLQDHYYVNELRHQYYGIYELSVTGW